MGGGLGTLVIILLAMMLGMNPQKILEQPGFQKGAAPEKRQLDRNASEPKHPSVNSSESSFAIPKMSGRNSFANNSNATIRHLNSSLYRKRSVGLRPSEFRGGTVLLSGRCECLSRFRLLSRTSTTIRGERGFRHGLCDWTRGRPSCSKPSRNLRSSNSIAAAGGEKVANQLSVRLELQADYLAGVWAHHLQKTKQVLEEGDIEEAIRAAQQIGDDKIQKKMTGYVMPEKFTHGPPNKEPIGSTPDSNRAASMG